MDFTSVFTHLIDGIFGTNASDTVRIIGAVGFSFLLLGAGVAIAFVGMGLFKVGEGVGKIGGGIGSHIDKAGDWHVNGSLALSNLSEGIADMIGFPVAAIEANEHIRLAEIQAAAQKNTLRLINGDRRIEIDMQGDGANDGASKVLGSMHSTSQTLYTLPEPAEPAGEVIEVKPQRSRGLLKFPGRS